MKQLQSNWQRGDIDMAQAKATLRVALLKLVDFDLSQKMQAAINNKKFKVPVEDPNCYDEELAMDEECTMHEVEIDYAIVQKNHREGARVAELKRFLLTFSFSYTTNLFQNQLFTRGVIRLGVSHIIEKSSKFCRKKKQKILYH